MAGKGWRLIVLALVAVPALACNLAQGAPQADQPTPAAATSTGDDSAPQIVIESPAGGSQAVVGKDLSVRVHAMDGVGITRVEMRESGRIVSSQFSPDSSRDFTTVFNYHLGSTGTLTLQVIAFRQSIASSPATLSVDVVGSEAEVKGPDTPICTVRPTTPLNLRAGPGTNYRVLATLKAGEDLSVIGRNADSTWYLVKRSDATSGWVSVANTTVDGD